MKGTDASGTGRVEIKVVGASGQISLGKRFAGKTLRLERLEDGSVVITPVAMVPVSQLWTLAEPDRSRIARGLAWAAETAAKESDLDDLARAATTPPRKPRGGRR